MAEKTFTLYALITTSVGARGTIKINGRIDDKGYYKLDFAGKHISAKSIDKLLDMIHESETDSHISFLEPQVLDFQVMESFRNKSKL